MQLDQTDEETTRFVNASKAAAAHIVSAVAAKARITGGHF
jgi:hypothetical protein